MARPTSGGRRVHTGIESSGAHPVEYRFSHARNGNRHLLVVFANFSAEGGYGWSNGVFDDLRSNILWIRDRFDGESAYYLCRDMDFSVEQSVVNLIGRVLNALGLTPDQCTLWGGSKGGSAALYLGLRYGFRNIVSLVPQFLVGTYVRDVHPRTARHMLGEGVPEEHVRALDAVLPDTVRSVPDRKANVYLLSSPQDEQFPVQVEPFLPLFQDYENFNFVLSDSPHISDHTTVTRRNVPLLMGLANFLVDGISPRFGTVRNGLEEVGADTSAIDAYLRTTTLVRGASFPPPVLTRPAPGEELRADGVRFTGTAPGAVRVSLWEDGKFLGTPDVAADGGWTWETGHAWGVGEHCVRVFAVDAAGHQSRRAEVRFSVAKAPTAPIVSAPAQGEERAADDIGFTGLARGAVQVGLRERGVLLGLASVGPDQGWSWTSPEGWRPGAHVVEVFGVDAAGVETASYAVRFTVTAEGGRSSTGWPSSEPDFADR
ncbi:hypothetical protein [Streptomyces phytohabitans]|uniref:hypothetical protein n=1 Tax=Streptomyces phytohabitans TaxID=1150371 RepID=UPI00345B71DF